MIHFRSVKSHIHAKGPSSSSTWRAARSARTQEGRTHTTVPLRCIRRYAACVATVLRCKVRSGPKAPSSIGSASVGHTSRPMPHAGALPVCFTPPHLHPQATFAATETVGTLRALAAGVLAPQLAPAAYLYTTPPRTVLKGDSDSLYHCGLVPAAHVHVGLDEKKGKSTSSVRVVCVPYTKCDSPDPLWPAASRLSGKGPGVAQWQGGVDGRHGGRGRMVADGRRGGAGQWVCWWGAWCLQHTCTSGWTRRRVRATGTGPSVHDLWPQCWGGLQGASVPFIAFGYMPHDSCMPHSPHSYASRPTPPISARPCSHPGVVPLLFRLRCSWRLQRAGPAAGGGGAGAERHRP